MENEFERLDVAAKEYDDASEHPTPEQMLLKLAIEQLSQEQRDLWERWAYEQADQFDIAKGLGISQQAVSDRIATIEKKIAKWCKQNKGAYLLLKLDKKVNENI